MGEDLKKSHPALGPSDIQGAGQETEPLTVSGKGHEIGTVGEAVPNSSASAKDDAALVALNPTQTVEVKTDVSGSRDYKRVPLTQAAVAGMGATPVNAGSFNDGRKK